MWWELRAHAWPLQRFDEPSVWRIKAATAVRSHLVSAHRGNHHLPGELRTIWEMMNAAELVE